MRIPGKRLWVVIAVVSIAGIAIAAGAAFYFLAPKEGAYVGPGLPVSKALDVSLPNDGSYYGLGVHFNSTVASAWLNFSGSGATNVTVEYGIMNQTAWSAFTNNTGISWLTEVSSDNDFAFHAFPSQTTDYTFYLVALATQNDSRFVGTFTVTALA